MAYIQAESRSQTSLFPVSLEELIPEDHIDLYVARLDLGQSGFDKAQPKATGRPAYDPVDQLKLYLYGYFQRIRSSRRLEAECQRNIDVPGVWSKACLWLTLPLAGCSAVFDGEVQGSLGLPWGYYSRSLVVTCTQV